ncbi:MAG TPA: hypothetical protein DCL66_04740 [Gammaproteobacteria bacterium]|nr:hypothetical protein [Gammaproteobacteria bacterium]
MTLEDFKQTIESLGTDPAHWPIDTREHCERLLKSNSEARLLLNEQSELDRLLQKMEAPAFLGLETRILNQDLPPRPQSLIDSIVDWLIPDQLGAKLWRPAIAACLPLVFGVLVGNFFSFGVTEQELALEYWDDELALLSFNDFSSDLDEAEL